MCLFVSPVERVHLLHTHSTLCESETRNSIFSISSFNLLSTENVANTHLTQSGVSLCLPKKPVIIISLRRDQQLNDTPRNFMVPWTATSLSLCC